MRFAAPSKGWDGGLTGDGSDIGLPACVWEERRKQKIRPGNLFHRIYDYYTYFYRYRQYSETLLANVFSFYGYNGKYSREIKFTPAFSFFCKFLSKYGLKAQKRGWFFHTKNWSCGKNVFHSALSALPGRRWNGRLVFYSRSGADTFFLAGDVVQSGR